MTRKQLVFPIILIIFVIIIFWLKGEDVAAPTEEQNNNQNKEVILDQAYLVEENSFSFDLPPDITAEETTADNIKLFSISTAENEDRILVAEINTIIPEQKSNITQFITDQFMSKCLAEGYGLSIKCTGIESYETWKNEQGLDGFSFYLRQETSFLIDDSIENDSKGPFYGFLIDDKIVIIQPPISQISNQSNADLIKKIANTIKKI